MAPEPLLCGSRRHPALGGRRQRPAPVHHAQTVASYPAHRRPGRGPGRADRDADRRSPLRRPGGRHRRRGAPGWNAPDLAPWLRTSLGEACRTHFGQDLQLYGEGGTIPFMGMLGERFPAAQFVITGVLGPGSNAHGPNEFIDVAYAEKLTRALAQFLDASSRR
ncbi:MAG: M20/M25/M40 family metallo-hydrolase [Acidimicrobiia bacterium]|nr:M20/M25/M40 family metallo-hydrolase [Acidimicrobiia bacterium]